VARAAYFPSISLTGNGGVQSSALGTLFGIGAGSWSAVLTAAQPVFTAGRTRSQVAFAEARTQQATAAYSQTVKQAFREASDSLVGYTKAREFRVQQEALTTAAQDGRRLADVRYQGGATSYLEVLNRHASVRCGAVARTSAAGGIVGVRGGVSRAWRRLAAGRPAFELTSPAICSCHLTKR
jgi:multidrug efflux system outer membrane protein